MKAIYREDIILHYMNRARKIITGKIVQPSVQYSGTRQGIHLSDLQGCPALPYYSRIYGEEAPPILDNSILYFLRGRQVEKAFHENEVSTTCEGISCTADDYNEQFGYTEIKSTAEQMDFFDPLTAHKEWIERTLGYMYAFKQKQWNLVIFFIVGNMPNKLWWNIKEFGKSTVKYQGVALKAWTLYAEGLEIADNWTTMLARKREIEKCIEGQIPPSDDYIEMMIEEWMHKTCQMQPVCEYYQNHIENKE